MDYLTGTVGLVLGFSGLIFIHELGHFLLAKWNGVRVHVFSLGMGPYLVSFTWRGTVYVLSMIPIGGYVKLMGQDDLNPTQDASKDPKDYRNKRPGQKAAILAAGAAFNVIFTIAAFTFCYYIGLDVLPARIGNVRPGTPIADATIFGTNEPAKLAKGDRILKVNGVPVKTFLEAMLQVSQTPGGSNLYLKIERDSDGDPGLSRVAEVEVHPEHDKRMGAPGIGLDQYTELKQLPLGFSTTNIVAIDKDPSVDQDTKRDTPAKIAGLRKGDEIISINGEHIRKQMDLTWAVHRSEGKPLKFGIRRNGVEETVEITPAKVDKTYRLGVEMTRKQIVVAIDENSEAYKKGLRKGDFVMDFRPTERVTENGKEIWKKGRLSWKKDWASDKEETATLSVPAALTTAENTFTREAEYTEHFKAASMGEALGYAWDDTLRFSMSVFYVIKGLFSGDVDKKAVSGPLGIGGVIAGVAKDTNFMRYFWLLGFISLNLGVLQFVPIPLLDGFHLVMVFVEKLKGSPVAPKVQEMFQYVGLFLVGGLLLLSTYNDIRRFFDPYF